MRSTPSKALLADSPQSDVKWLVEEGAPTIAALRGSRNEVVSVVVTAPATERAAQSSLAGMYVYVHA